MFILIDNYDSFTYNLYHYFCELGAEMEVHRNDRITVDEVLRKKPRGIVLSPGPCDPSRAGICLDLIRKAAGNVPVFGVCLGLQAIGQAFGGKIVRAHPMHGKTSPIHHNQRGIFADIPQGFTATRYHSLVVEPDSLPSELSVTARTEDGHIMGMAHARHAIYGVQFHPESIATEHGHRLLGNFLALTGHNVVA
ncbi:MAG TPA: aminodeoxychorismate/anthranilate synthase component II [Dongiaceae bacterium]|jgi:anthranilate synthase component 2|nr:aminodeoxychorismate/anthranilate synthase component II [Dongiaceae bacterium]